MGLHLVLEYVDGKPKLRKEEFSENFVADKPPELKVEPAPSI